MLKFDRVTKTFKEDFWKDKKVVLNQFSFNLTEGSLCGFLGANGAGKTTSIKAMLGFIDIDSGEIHFSKSMGNNRQQIKSNIGYFPERPYFYPHMTGREFCTYLGQLQNVANNELKKNIDHWSERLNISFALDKKINFYSKGMLQRLGFVSALIHSPKLIILDEPLSGLDPIGRREFKNIMVDLHKDGKTVFFSSHIVSDVEEVCDSLVVIKDGQQFYEGKTMDLMNKHSKDQFEIAFSTNIQLEEVKRKVPSLEVKMSQENHYSGLIELKDKMSLLNYSIENQINLLEFKKVKSSLEEIIYSTDQVE